jgi:hypothetical protein
VGVLVEPAIAHLGEAKHPLDDPDRMFGPWPGSSTWCDFSPAPPAMASSSNADPEAPRPGSLGRPASVKKRLSVN